MNKNSKGIERALEMKKWSSKRGGMPPVKDPFSTGKAGPFDRYSLKWFEALRRRGLSESTIVTYRWALLRYRRWLLRNHTGSYERLAPLLGRRRVESFINHLISHESVSSQTQAALVGTLKRFSGWLTNERHLKNDPLSRIETIKIKHRKLPRSLPFQQISQLLTVPEITDPIGIRDRAILELFYATGLRRAELATINLQDLNFHETQIRVENGKGGKQRIVPAGQRAFHWIRLYLEKTRPLLTGVKEPEAPLFVTGYGDAFAISSMGHLVRGYLNKAEVTIRGSCHLFRHSCATHLLDGGAGLCSIQRILGHSRLDTTAIYTHVSTERLNQIHARCHPHGDLAEQSDTSDCPKPPPIEEP